MFSSKKSSSRTHYSPKSSLKKGLVTTAVYWEPKVKTYGFQLATGLSLVDWCPTTEQLTAWGARLHSRKERSPHFALVLMQYCSFKGLHLCLLLEAAGLGNLLEGLEMPLSEEDRGSVRIQSPVEMIHFQGPHFGDRYGIAATAFAALTHGGISILAAACSGASIYLVLPEKTAETAKSLLEKVFEVPRTSFKKKPSR